MALSINVTVPKFKGIDITGLESDLNAELDAIAEDIKEDLLKPTATWARSVAFDITTPEPGQRLIATSDQRYNWIDKGTEGPYEIRAKKPGGRLAFGVPFKAKTQPGSLSASAGGSGGLKIIRQSVMHPGIEPRKFSTQVAEIWSKKAQARITRTIINRLRK